MGNALIDAIVDPHFPVGIEIIISPWWLFQLAHSNIDHKEKSIGLNFGLEGGHSSLEMKSRIFFRKHSWLTCVAWLAVLLE